jgi:hypothetical protein
VTLAIRRRLGRLAAGAVGLIVGAVIGAVVSLTIQSGSIEPWRESDRTSTSATVEPRGPHHRPDDGRVPAADASPPAASTFLAWTPGGLPREFDARLRRLRVVHRHVVVASDVVWMTRSTSSDGGIVDQPKSPFAIPLEAIAVDPASFAPFLPQAERSRVEAALAAGEGILGASSADLRDLGPGGTIEIGDHSVRIAHVLPDELVGASELLVSRRVGRRIGVEQDRYALIEPRPVGAANKLGRALRRIVAADTPVQVRAPGDTPYPRQGDSVLPPVRIKLLFGEFAARPIPGGTGFLDVDPAWVDEHVDTRRLPLVGNIQCNVAFFPQLRGALEDLIRRGLGRLIHSEHGCYVPKFVLNDPHASISHHAWGMAFDVNLAGNEFGTRPHQDPRLVRTLARWGLVWGGRFIVPDGNHFEYRRPPDPSTQR